MFSVNDTVSVQLNCQITATLSSDLKVWFKLAVTLPCLFECLRRSVQVSNNVQSYFFLEAAASCPQTSSSGVLLAVDLSFFLAGSLALLSALAFAF